jgi:hypothetical protein
MVAGGSRDGGEKAGIEVGVGGGCGQVKNCGVFFFCINTVMSVIFGPREYHFTK